jgi:hypothetical protein
VLLGNSCGGGGGGGGGGVKVAKADVFQAKKVKKVKGLTTEGIPVTDVNVGVNPEARANEHRLDLKLIGENTKKQSDKGTQEEKKGQPCIKDAKWGVERCWFGDEIELKIITKGMKDGTKLLVKLFEWDALNPDDFIEEKEISSTGDETTFKWKAEFDAAKLYEYGEGDEFEIYPIIKIKDTDTAAVFREMLVYVDVVRLRAGV